MVNTLGRHRTEILNWYEDPLSDDPMESINPRIAVIRRIASGDGCCVDIVTT
jgi:transposase